MNSQLNIDEDYQQYLAYLYKDTISHSEYTEDDKVKFKHNNVCPTYGELLYPSIIKLLKSIHIPNNSTFVDMGSGLGKLALTVFLRSNVKQVVGIEANKKLHSQAANILTKLEKEVPSLYQEDRGIALYCANFLEADLSKVDIVYSCSTCFSENLVNLIGNKIENYKNIRQVVSLKPLPTLERLPLKQVLELECSWDSTLAYYYHNL